MDFEAKSIDEELTGLVDTYDGLIAPRSIWRNNNNKLYLVFKSIGAGFSRIRDIVLALKNRFDARYCTDDDLESAMFITGERKIAGKQTVLRMTVANNDLTDPVTLRSGNYIFTSPQGQLFTFNVQQDGVIQPASYEVILFASQDVGAFSVSDAANVAVTREDGLPIDARLQWNTLDNSASLGRPEENNFDIRTRILTDTTRQDTLKELEMAIKAIPTIFECNLIFNPDSDDSVTLEDETVLLPKELLIVITGVPTPELAETVLSRIVYKTKMVNFDQVSWYYNDLFVGGRYPVYYKFHAQEPFYLTLYYTFDRSKLKKEQVDAMFTALLARFKNMTQHLPEINEPIVYRALENHNIPGVELKKAYIQVMQEGSLVSVPLVPIPRLSMAQLAGITFVAEERTA